MTGRRRGLIAKPVSTLPKINRLELLSARYDALLCDAWGVIHDGVELFSGAAEAMIRFRDVSGPVIILTNAPRPSTIIPGQLDRLGLPRSAYDDVVTSGDATRAEIERRVPGPAYRLGPDKDDPLYHGLDIEFAPLGEARFIVCTGLVDDDSETPEDYRGLLEQAAARRLPMICANPDTVVRWGGRLVYCAGALGEIYAALGGEVIYGGKPYAPIYDLATKRIETISGAKPDPRRVLAIGDGLATDIAGANAHGIDAVFVAGAGGVHDGGLDAELIRKKMDAAGVTAIGIMEALRW
ncbi:MAG: TIGR01459 family HAD-type hydrolase [Parvularculaceae bacterium]